MALHDLKCWPEPFAALEAGTKRHEVRRNDRNYKVGDVLGIREWKPYADYPGGGYYTGRTLKMRVTYITKPGTFGLPADVCVMSLAPYRGKKER